MTMLMLLGTSFASDASDDERFSEDDEDDEDGPNEEELRGERKRPRAVFADTKVLTRAAAKRAARAARVPVDAILASRRFSQLPNPSRRLPNRGSSGGNVAYRSYSREEAVFYDAAGSATRKSIDVLEARMKELEETDTPLRFRVLLSEVDERVKGVAVRKLESLRSLDRSSPEYHKILSWVDALCRLPIGKYCKLPVDAGSPPEEQKRFLLAARDKLDGKVYGHDRAKEQILRLIAQWITNPSSKGMVLGIHGCHGCGKTTLVKEGICEVLGMPFAFLPLGGASDSAYLEGHSYTYEGSTWGKVADVLMKCRVSNPVLYFDELDKVSETYKGDEIINKLIHLTDGSQNERFADKYFHDIDLDLSRCLVIFSYNHEERVNAILRDRMLRIRTDGYALKDKKKIASGYLLPELLPQFNMRPGDVTFSDDMIAYFVEYVEAEQGVRNLKRALHEVLSALNLKRLMEPEQVHLPITATREHVHEFVKTAIRHASAAGAPPLMYT